VKRKDFILKSLAGSILLMGFPVPLLKGDPIRNEQEYLLNAYYFRTHKYKLVPENAKYDMDRIVSIEAIAVPLAIPEQDLFAAVENHNLNEKYTELPKKRLAEVSEYKPDHLICYYFPRNLSNSDEIMTIMENQIKKHYVTIQ